MKLGLNLRRLSGSRRLCLLLFYTAGLSLSLYLAYQLRFDFSVVGPYDRQFLSALIWIVPLQLVVLMAFGQFSGKLSIFGVPDLSRLLPALGISSIFILLLRNTDKPLSLLPRGVIAADLALAFVILGGVRLGLRMALEGRNWKQKPNRTTRRVGIIGAGDAGGSIARELLAKRHLALEPTVFFDDDTQIWHSHIHGIPVVGPPELLLFPSLPREKLLDRLLRGLFRPRIAKLHLNEIIIAMPSAPAWRMGEVVRILHKSGLPFRTVPALDQLATGAVNISRVRPVEIQDLLGREPVRIETGNIQSVLAGRAVMVTGAGGSIGSELCRQIAGFGPRVLLMVEQSEPNMFRIEQDLVSRNLGRMIQPCIANVLDQERMNSLFERWMPEIVFHAAAHKHVPMMESHPGEAIKNNTLGTAGIAQLCLQHDVERFVLISTDKAINPTNVMGASKRLAEMFVQALHAASPGGTKLMGVRFGNVLGSSGSVIPTFARQIAAGGPVKVTHPEITRYFMTIPEAVSLVLQSCAQGEGGEIFVLDMGKPVRILDLARKMIALSGLTPEVDIKIEFVGLRPGEKLYEELSTEGENIAPTLHPKIMRFVSEVPDLEEMLALLESLSSQLHTNSANQLKLELQRAIPEYRPFLLPSREFHPAKAAV